MTVKSLCLIAARKLSPAITPGESTSSSEVVQYSTEKLGLARKAFSALVAGKIPSENYDASLRVQSANRVGAESSFVSVISISALGSPEGWQWNDVHHIGKVPLHVTRLSNRRILRWMRENGYRVPQEGRAMVDDDGYNVVICHRGTREPLYALAYGEAR